MQIFFISTPIHATSDACGTGATWFWVCAWHSLIDTSTVTFDGKLKLLWEERWSADVRWRKMNYSKLSQKIWSLLILLKMNSISQQRWRHRAISLRFPKRKKDRTLLKFRTENSKSRGTSVARIALILRSQKIKKIDMFLPFSYLFLLFRCFYDK